MWSLLRNLMDSYKIEMSVLFHWSVCCMKGTIRQWLLPFPVTASEVKHGSLVAHPLLSQLLQSKSIFQANTEI